MVGELKLMYYLVRETMGSTLVVIGQYPTKSAANKRKDLEDQNKYSFEVYSVCTEEEYTTLLMSYV